MKGKIFISYKRNDSSGSTGRINDRLKKHFSKESIFMDVDNIRLGENFIEAIERDVKACDILLAVIGKDWLKIIDQNNKTILNNPDDWVRVEIRTALERNIRIVPILVDNGSMPHLNELPEDIKHLANRLAMEIRHNRFDSDVEQLIKDLQKILDDIAKNKIEVEEQSKTKQMEEERKRKAKELNNIKKDEEEKKKAEMEIKIKQFLDVKKVTDKEQTKPTEPKEESRKLEGPLIKTEKKGLETYEKITYKIKSRQDNSKKQVYEPSYLSKIFILLITSSFIAFAFAVFVRFFIDPNNISFGTILGSLTYWFCFAFSFVFCVFAFFDPDEK